MKNCTKIVFFARGKPHGRVILVPFKKCPFSSPVSAVYEFFKGASFEFSMSEVKALAEYPAKNASFFYVLPNYLLYFPLFH